MKFNKDLSTKKNLKFKVYDCPVKAILKNVEVVEHTADKLDKDNNPRKYEYAGLDVPNLYFRFKQVGIDEDGIDLASEDRLLNVVLDVPVYVKNDGSTMSDNVLESILNSIWAKIKHIAEDGFNIKISENEDVIKAFSELYEKFTIQPEERLKLFKNAYQAVVNAFEGGYKIDDKYVVVYLKVVANYSSKKYHIVPNYINEGFIERVRYGEGGKPIRSTLRLQPSETIKLISSTPAETDTVGDDTEISDDVRDAINDI